MVLLISGFNALIDLGLPGIMRLDPDLCNNFLYLCANCLNPSVEGPFITLHGDWPDERLGVCRACSRYPHFDDIFDQRKNQLTRSPK